MILLLPLVFLSGQSDLLLEEVGERSEEPLPVGRPHREHRLVHGQFLKRRIYKAAQKGILSLSISPFWSSSPSSCATRSSCAACPCAPPPESGCWNSGPPDSETPRPRHSPVMNSVWFMRDALTFSLFEHTNKLTHNSVFHQVRF